jgi:hypothetical protein
MTQAVDKVMTVDEWRKLDALAPGAVNEAIKACCLLQGDELDVCIKNLKFALEAGCPHRDNPHSRGYFRLHQIAFALFAHPDAMRDIATAWVQQFIDGREGPDGNLHPYLNKEGTLGHLVEMSASQTGPGGIEMLGIIRKETSGFDWLDQYHLRAALDRAINAANPEFLHELLGRDTVYDHDNPLPTIMDPRSIGLITIEEPPPVSALLHAAKSIIGVGDDGGPNGTLKIRGERLASFEAIKSHLAPGYSEPYHEMFEWMSHNARHLVPAMRQRAIPDAVVFVALGATPRPNKAKQGWTQLLRTKTLDGNAELGEFSVDVPLAHSMVSSAVDSFIAPALHRLVQEGGLDLNLATKRGVTLLMRAARLNKTTAVETLLDLGADATLSASKIYAANREKSYSAADMAELAGNHDLAAKLRAHVAREAVLAVAAAANKGMKP